MKHNFKAILLDMDGVLYHGEHALPGAIHFMQSIAQIPHAFITNNPILPANAVADRLQRLGFQRPDANKIITSAEATALYLSQQQTNFRYFAVGANGLHLALQAHGIEDHHAADYVVIGEGAAINYELISIGVNLILKHGAQLICTNPDPSVDGFKDGKHFILPGGGALVAPFAIAAETDPLFIGKPYPLLYEIALQRLGVQAQDCLMIGDRPDTDIIGAATLGMKTALVRTGRFAPSMPLPEAMKKPDWDVAGLAQLMELFE